MLCLRQCAGIKSISSVAGGKSHMPELPTADKVHAIGAGCFFSARAYFTRCMPLMPAIMAMGVT